MTTADKETIKALISLVSNHDKAIMVANAMTRVDVLEQRLDNKTAAVEETLERKLDSMDRQRSNYSLAFNVALFVCGVLAGIVVTLVFG